MAGKGKGEGKAELRVSKRKRQVAQGLRKVDKATRQQVAAARLDALENDNVVSELVEGNDDSDDYIISEDSEGEEKLRMPGKANRRMVKNKKDGKRKTRGALAQKQGPKSFTVLMEEANLEALPLGAPSYLTAASPPPVAYPPRFFCSICGCTAPYTCVRCGARVCCRKCTGLHNDTRCMKFTV